MTSEPEAPGACRGTGHLSGPASGHNPGALAGPGAVTRAGPSLPGSDPRSGAAADLTADCSRCAALCCLMLAFDRGPMFAIDKPAGMPCANLHGHACGIHDGLERRGFAGCVRYDCQGAGQIVVQKIFAGRSWRDEPALLAPMTGAFAVLREVQDLRAQLAAARRLGLPAAALVLADEQEARLAPVWSSATLAAFDLAAARAAHAELLKLLRAALTVTGVAVAGGAEPPAPGAPTAGKRATLREPGRSDGMALRPGSREGAGGAGGVGMPTRSGGHADTGPATGPAIGQVAGAMANGLARTTRRGRP